MLSVAGENAENRERFVQVATSLSSVEKRRVAVYIRYDHHSIQTSYQYQEEHYQAFLNKHPEWEPVRVYADKCDSGKEREEQRIAFRQMLQDCEGGKIDMVITWTVTHFSSNILECLILIDKLLRLNPSVGVFFELQNYYTLNEGNGCHAPRERQRKAPASARSRACQKRNPGRH